MKQLRRICLFVVLLAGTIFAQSKDGDQIGERNKELKEIQQQIDDRKRTLDSLKAAEQNVTKQLSDMEGKITSDKKVISRLNSELQQLQGKMQALDSQVAAGQSRQSMAKERLLGSMRDFYMASRAKPHHLFGEPNQELELERKLNYLGSMTKLASADVEQARALLVETTGKLQDVTGQSRKVSTLKKEKESAVALTGAKKATQEKSLVKLRRKHSLTADELITLEQAAKAMEGIITRLEAARQEAERTHQQPAFVSAMPLADLKGQLKAPCKGEIVVPYGARTDDVTKLKSFSPGITISTKAGSNVCSIAGGVVVYVSDLRGYGRFVIVRHDETHYATYAGLASTGVSTNQQVYSGDILGTAGEDGIVRFELREGRQTLDPVEWLRLDSF